jgi:sterol desaturase/sphingolipid hydroxylase (fatty acid hydroxylase superfamily)
LEIIEVARRALPAGLIDAIGNAYSYVYAVLNAYALQSMVVIEVLGLYLSLELIIPRSRPSWGSYLRSFRFWLVNVFITVLVFSLFPRLVNLTLFEPLKVIDLTPLTTSGHWPLRLIGYFMAAFAAAFLGNFNYYWFHRAQHVMPALWRIHKVHHSIQELSAVNSYHHFLEDLCEFFLILLPVALLVRFDSGDALPSWVVFLVGTQSYFVHCSARLNIGPLRYVIGENRFHRIHHSLEPRHFNKNFGTVTPLYDVLFGTAYFPKKDEWPATGLADTPEPTRIADLLAMPFRTVPSNEAGPLAGEK